ncbi:MAG: FxsA family protein [Nocardioides sp.]
MSGTTTGTPSGTPGGSRRRRGLTWLLLVAFIVVPLVEIYVLIQVGQVIGPWWTILLLVADSILGSWLIKREGSRAWRALRAALDSGRMPGAELADGALILVGGTLMLTPGFVTDGLGILLILPFTRPVFRRVLARVVSRRLVASRPAWRGDTGAPDAKRPGPRSQGSVVQGEVVDDDG